MIEVVLGSGLDIPQIMPVMDDAFDPHFGEAWTAAQCLATLAMPGSVLFVAKQEERAVGFALSRWVMDEEELLLIGVLHRARKQNVGAELIAKLKSNARDLGRSNIFLEVRDGNPAQLFYRKMGFQAVGTRPSYYKAKDGSRYDSITMAMNIFASFG
jgi:[ribosomal protein S18]-alanine N-acetyltransferase